MASRQGRFLFVVPPFAGHVNPTIPLGRELVRRGHHVAWAGYVDNLASLLGPADDFISIGEGASDEVVQAAMGSRLGPVGVRETWRAVVAGARDMMPGTQAAIDAFRPDVLIVDQQTVAGAIAAELRGLPWVTSATTSVEIVDLVGDNPMGRWVRQLLHDYMVECGVEPSRAEAVDPRTSPYLIVAYTTHALVGESLDIPDKYALVGPMVGERTDDTPFPWEWLEQGPGPRVLVSLGTVAMERGTKFFPAAAEALAGMDARAVFVAEDHLLPNPPPNVLVRRRVPQLDLLPHLDAVVTHGGHNTVCEALAHGLPLVVAPIQDDQPMIARQVVQSGSGVRVRFFRAKPPMLRQAIEQVLTEPQFRAAADRLRHSFVAAGGAKAGADRVEAVLQQVSVAGS
jgi:MGT family glycosyltransferase